jgi:hypothetical protein
VTRFKEIFGRQGIAKPLDSDGFVIGVFQIVFGLWLLLPFESFSFISLAGANDALAPIYGHPMETWLGTILVFLGLIDIVCIWYRKYIVLKNMDIVGAAYWAFITASWIMTAPQSTAVIVYGFFTLFSIYEFYVWSVFCKDAGLRDKRNRSNI